MKICPCCQISNSMEKVYMKMIYSSSLFLIERGHTICCHKNISPHISKGHLHFLVQHSMQAVNSCFAHWTNTPSRIFQNRQALSWWSLKFKESASIQSQAICFRTGNVDWLKNTPACFISPLHSTFYRLGRHGWAQHRIIYVFGDVILLLFLHQSCTTPNIMKFTEAMTFYYLLIALFGCNT